jgi:hypothetical protein
VIAKNQNIYVITFLTPSKIKGPTIQKLWQKRDARRHCVSPRRLEELPLTLVASCCSQLTINFVR